MLLKSICEDYLLQLCSIPRISSSCDVDIDSETLFLLPLSTRREVIKHYCNLLNSSSNSSSNSNSSNNKEENVAITVNLNAVNVNGSYDVFRNATNFGVQTMVDYLGAAFLLNVDGDFETVEAALDVYAAWIKGTAPKRVPLQAANMELRQLIWVSLCARMSVLFADRVKSVTNQNIISNSNSNTGSNAAAVTSSPSLTSSSSSSSDLNNIINNAGFDVKGNSSSVNNNSNISSSFSSSSATGTATNNIKHNINNLPSESVKYLSGSEDEVKHVNLCMKALGIFCDAMKSNNLTFETRDMIIRILIGIIEDVLRREPLVQPRFRFCLLKSFFECFIFYLASAEKPTDACLELCRARCSKWLSYNIPEVVSTWASVTRAVVSNLIRILFGPSEGTENIFCIFPGYSPVQMNLSKESVLFAVEYFVHLLGPLTQVTNSDIFEDYVRHFNTVMEVLVNIGLKEDTLRIGASQLSGVLQNASFAGLLSPKSSSSLSSTKPPQITSSSSSASVSTTSAASAGVDPISSSGSTSITSSSIAAAATTAATTSSAPSGKNNPMSHLTIQLPGATGAGGLIPLKGYTPDINSILVLMGDWLFDAACCFKHGFDKGRNLAIFSMLNIFCSRRRKDPVSYLFLARLYRCYLFVLRKLQSDNAGYFGMLQNTHHLFRNHFPGSSSLIPDLIVVCRKVLIDTGNSNINANQQGGLQQHQQQQGGGGGGQQSQSQVNANNSITNSVTSSSSSSNSNSSSSSSSQATVTSSNTLSNTGGNQSTTTTTTSTTTSTTVVVTQQQTMNERKNCINIIANLVCLSAFFGDTPIRILDDNGLPFSTSSTYVVAASEGIDNFSKVRSNIWMILKQSLTKEVDIDNLYLLISSICLFVAEDIALDTQSQNIFSSAITSILNVLLVTGTNRFNSDIKPELLLFTLRGLSFFSAFYRNLVGRSVAGAVILMKNIITTCLEVIEYYLQALQLSSLLTNISKIAGLDETNTVNIIDRVIQTAMKTLLDWSVDAEDWLLFEQHGTPQLLNKIGEMLQNCIKPERIINEKEKGKKINSISPMIANRLREQAAMTWQLIAINLGHFPSALGGFRTSSLLSEADFFSTDKNRDGMSTVKHYVIPEQMWVLSFCESRKNPLDEKDYRSAVVIRSPFGKTVWVNEEEYASSSSLLTQSPTVSQITPVSGNVIATSGGTKIQLQPPPNWEDGSESNQLMNAYSSFLSKRKPSSVMVSSFVDKHDLYVNSVKDSQINVLKLDEGNVNGKNNAASFFYNTPGVLSHHKLLSNLGLLDWKNIKLQSVDFENTYAIDKIPERECFKSIILYIHASAQAVDPVTLLSPTASNVLSKSFTSFLSSLGIWSDLSDHPIFSKLARSVSSQMLYWSDLISETCVYVPSISEAPPASNLFESVKEIVFDFPLKIVWCERRDASVIDTRSMSQKPSVTITIFPLDNGLFNVNIRNTFSYISPMHFMPFGETTIVSLKILASCIRFITATVLHKILSGENEKSNRDSNNSNNNNNNNSNNICSSCDYLSWGGCLKRKQAIHLLCSQGSELSRKTRTVTFFSDLLSSTTN